MTETIAHLLRALFKQARWQVAFGGVAAVATTLTALSTYSTTVSTPELHNAVPPSSPAPKGSPPGSPTGSFI